MSIETDGTPNGKVVECHKYVCSTGDTNHNKYWNCWLYDSDDVQIEFGRIGVTSTKGVHRGAGKSFMLKKMAEKEKGKVNKETGEREPYTELQVLGADFSTQASSGKSLSGDKIKAIAKAQIQYTSPITAKLIDYLADVNRHQISDVTGGNVTWNADTGLFQTPLGIVLPSAISDARQHLIKIGDFVAENKFGKPFRNEVEAYLTLIPHNLGMRWSPESFISSLSDVQKENGILDALDASYLSAVNVPTADGSDTKKETPKVFETKLLDVEDGKVIDRINKKYKDSINKSHYAVSSFKLKKVWEVEVTAVSRAFEVMSKKLGNVMELWHGTQPSNLLSILKAGLVIPPASSPHCTGRLYGDGLYFSDQSTKSLNYATNFWGKGDMGRYFMFLSNVALGKSYTPRGGISRPPAGYDSVFAKAGQSGVVNNEFIVYSTAQSNLVYLCEFGK